MLSNKSKNKEFINKVTEQVMKKNNKERKTKSSEIRKIKYLID